MTTLLDLSKKIYKNDRGFAKQTVGSRSQTSAVRHGTAQADSENGYVTVLIDGSEEPVTLVCEVPVAKNQRVSVASNGGTYKVVSVGQVVEIAQNAKDASEQNASQIEQVRVTAQEAQAAADEASEAAGEAQAEATAAAAKADQAIADASEAANTAEQARQTAATATEKADAAEAAVGEVEETVSSMQEDVNEANEKAESAKQASSEAVAKAGEAETAAQNAMSDAAEAKSATTSAQTAAASAEEKAADAKAESEDAISKAGEASATAAAAKADADKSREEIAALGEELETVSNTMTAEYARKTDLTETEASLQSRIEQNAAQISSTVTKLQTVDETANGAAEQAQAAQTAAGAAQTAADAAQADATAAQSAADQAAAAASAAQSEADTAKAAAAAAQGKADQAASDLATAQQNLANVTSRVDSTEEEIAAAQQAVTDAQAAADQAQADATEAAAKAATAQSTADSATTAAGNAQSAADDAAAKAKTAQETADKAVGDAATAKAAADQAAADAAAAQSTADTARDNATTAQNAADAAAKTAAAAQKAADDADSKAAQAASDLITAQQNLADVTSRVGATEEEIQAAQDAVETAQSAAEAADKAAKDAQDTADTAKVNAENAQTAANNAKKAADAAQADADAAKKAADAAQADVDALAVRVTTAETKIEQNSEAITLRATKTELTTVSDRVDSSVASVIRYYTLSEEEPAKPTENPPSGGSVVDVVWDGVYSDKTYVDLGGDIILCKVADYAPSANEIIGQTMTISTDEGSTETLIDSTSVHVMDGYLVIGDAAAISVSVSSVTLDGTEITLTRGLWFFANGATQAYVSGLTGVGGAGGPTSITWDGDTTGRDYVVLSEEDHAGQTTIAAIYKVADPIEATVEDFYGQTVTLKQGETIFSETLTEDSVFSIEGVIVISPPMLMEQDLAAVYFLPTDELASMIGAPSGGFYFLKKEWLLSASGETGMGFHTSELTLPGSYGGGGVSVEWSTVEPTAGPSSITWDGDTTGLVEFGPGSSVYKVSDTITSSVDELIGQSVTFTSTNPDVPSFTEAVTADTIVDASAVMGLPFIGIVLEALDYAQAVAIVHEPFSVDNISVSAGVYFMSMVDDEGNVQGYVSELTLPSGGGSGSLYYVDCTTYMDGSFSYSEVSKSSAKDVADSVKSDLAENYYTKVETDAQIQVSADSITSTVSKLQTDMETNYATKSEVTQTAEGITVELSESISEVDAKASDAAKTATSFLSYDSTNGLMVGNKSSGSWSGFRTQITSSAFNILDSAGSVLASYGAKVVELGKNAADSIIKLCGGRGTIGTSTSPSGVSALSLESDSVGVHASKSAVVWSNKYVDDGDFYCDRYAEIKVDADPDVVGRSECQINLLASFADQPPVEVEEGTSDVSYSEFCLTPFEIYGLTDEVQITGRYGMTLEAVSGDVKINGCTMAKNKVLWSGAAYMAAGHTLTFSEAVSAQPNGIVLVWVDYNKDTGTVATQGYWFSFIPKAAVSEFNSRFFTFSTRSWYSPGYEVVKGMYVGNTGITGHDLSITDNSYLFGTQSVLVRVYGV